MMMWWRHDGWESVGDGWWCICREKEVKWSEWEHKDWCGCEWWLGGSTTPWECEWEHKFSQSSEWVDLVVVRHHGSVHRDDMDGRVCEREDSVRVDLVVVRHHGSGNRHSLRTQVMWDHSVWWHKWEGCESACGDTRCEMVSVRRQVMGVSTQRSEVRENAGMSEHGSTSDGSE